MKPFQIFIILNIIFFLALPDIDVFRKPSSWWFKQNFEIEVNLQELIMQKSTHLGINREQLGDLYDSRSLAWSKSFVVLFIPFIGLGLSILYFRKKIEIGKHIIFATHYFSLMLLIMMIWTPLMNLLPITFSNTWYVIPVMLFFLISLTISVRRFYHSTWWNALAISIFMMVWINIFIELYRTMVSLGSLYYL